MKRHILLMFVLILLTSSTTEASCLSGFGSTSNHFIISDFVGIVEAQKVYDSPSEEDSHYIIEVKELKVFKGTTPETFNVMSDREALSVHGTYVSEGDVWLVYAFDDKDGEYYFGGCSSPRAKSLRSYDETEREISKRLQKELHQLELFKQKVPNLNRDYTIIEGELDLFEYLEKYNGQVFSKSFVQYLITFNSDLTIKRVKVLKGISTEFDQKIIEYLKNHSSWRTYIEPSRPEININTENARHLVGVYYFKEKRKLFPRIYVGYN